MLKNDRIMEAENNVRNYLREGLLKKSVFNNNVFNVFMKNSDESLRVAEFLAQNSRSPLWIIVTSYYSMFYIANAALYKLGYKVGSKIPHKITADALIVFVRSKLKEKLIGDFEEL